MKQNPLPNEIIGLKLKLAACQQMYSELFQAGSVMAEAAEDYLMNSMGDTNKITHLLKTMDTFKELHIPKYKNNK